MAIIYLALTLLAGSVCLPTNVSRKTGIGRAALQRWYTWHFSIQGLPFPLVAQRERGLLPHIFTLACRSFSEGSKPGDDGCARGVQPLT